MPSGSPAVIGLDIGTSAIKGLLVADDGRVVAAGDRTYALDFGADGRVEVDAELVRDTSLALIADLANQARVAGRRVVAICATGSGDESVWVDADDVPVAPVPMSLDGRSEADGRTLVAAVGAEAFALMTGLPPGGAYPLARMRWLRRVSPAVADRVRRLLAWPEYLAACLGADPRAEPTLAARTGGYDVRESRYDATLLAAAELAEDLLPPVVETGAVVGVVRGDRANALGLDADVKIVAGGFDQAMATVGAGVRAPGIGHAGAGSWEALTVLAEEGPELGLVLDGYSIGPSIGAGGLWSIMASGPGALALGWLGRLGHGEPELAARRAFDRAARAPDRPTGLVVLPHLTGPAAPHADHGSRGVIAGLDLATGPEAIALAMIEGIALDLASRLDRLASAGHPVHELRVSGGGSRDSRWLQLKADATGVPTRSVEPAVSGALGAAALAARAVGLATTVDETVDATLRLGPLVDPRPAHREAYVAHADRRRTVREGLGRDITAWVGRADPDAATMES
jgi:xylulokinase